MNDTNENSYQNTEGNQTSFGTVQDVLFNNIHMNLQAVPPIGTLTIFANLRYVPLWMGRRGRTIVRETGVLLGGFPCKIVTKNKGPLLYVWEKLLTNYS